MLSAAADRIHFRFRQQQVIVEPYAEVMRREWPGGVVDYVSRIVYKSGISWDAPSGNQRLLFRQAHERMRAVALDVNDLFLGECAALRELAAESGLPMLPETEAILLTPPLR